VPLSPPAAPILTPRLIVRTVDEADLPALMAVNGDPEVTRFLPYPAWQAMDDARAWLARMQTGMATGDTLQFVVAWRGDAGDSAPAIGSCLLFRHDAGSARAELGYVLGRAHWGTGVMREALMGLLGFAFAQAGIRRLEAEINPANVASMRLIQALGFSQEGLARERWLGRDGLPYDIARFGLLQREFMSCRPD
jgi:RimJ/RimL family protein N-acetyltransferase